MSVLIRLTASVLMAAVLLSVLPVAGEHRIYEDVLRLHVIAESDRADDQALKLNVRDAVLNCISGAVENCTSFEEANAVVGAMVTEIQSAAEACVRENGGSCTVTVELSPEKYPRRDYGSACLPAGVYQSLRVTLGDGAGKNWWCVLFPTVCIRFAGETADEDAYIAAGFTPEEYRIITGNDGGWKIKFRILEVFADIFSR